MSTASHLLLLCLLALPPIACSDPPQPSPPQITQYSNGDWFVPENSGAGPALRQIKAYVLYNGTVCLTVTATGAEVSSSDRILGLYCVPKPKQAPPHDPCCALTSPSKKVAP